MTETTTREEHLDWCKKRALQEPQKVTGDWMCCRNLHLWWDKSDAEKCCSGKWKRILVFGGGTHQQICAGVPIGRQWVPVTNPEPA